MHERARDARRFERPAEVIALADRAEQIDVARHGETAYDVGETDAQPLRRPPRVPLGQTQDPHGVRTIPTVRRRKRVVVYIASTQRGGAEIALRTLIGELDESIDVVMMGVDRAVCTW